MLIFCSFASREKAEAFAESVKKNHSRKTYVFDSQEEASKVDFFPYVLDPPIVMVERNRDYSGEEEIEASVTEFGGEFAGT